MKGINIIEDIKANFPLVGSVGEIVYASDTKEVGIRNDIGELVFQYWEKSSKNYFKVQGDTLTLNDSGKLVVVSGGSVSEYTYRKNTDSYDSIPWGMDKQTSDLFLEPNYHNVTDFPFVGKYSNDMNSTYSTLLSSDIVTKGYLNNYNLSNNIPLNTQTQVSPNYLNGNDIVNGSYLSSRSFVVPTEDPCTKGMPGVLWSPDGVNLQVSASTCARFRMRVYTNPFWDGTAYIKRAPIINSSTGTGTINIVNNGDQWFDVYSDGVIEHFSFNTNTIKSLENDDIYKIEFVVGLDINSMNYTFGELTNLLSLSIPTNTTRNVVDFSYSFYLCSSITNIPFMETNNGQNFNEAWDGCGVLKSFPSLDMRSATTFQYTWQDCIGMTSFPFINTSLVNDFTWSWKGCSSLSSFPKIDVSSGTDFDSTWRETSIVNFPTLDFSSSVSLYKTWKLNTSLRTINLKNTSNVLTMLGSFSGCSSLEYVPFMDVSSVTDFYDCWYNCITLTSFPPLDMSSGVDFTYTWQNCEALKTFSGVKFRDASTFKYAWYACYVLQTFSVIDSSKANSFYKTWKYCNSLTTFPNISTSFVTDFTEAWYNCSSLTSFPLIDTSSGTSFNSAWYSCTSLTSFPSLDVSSGVDFYTAWAFCAALITCPGTDGTVTIPTGATTTYMCYGI